MTLTRPKGHRGFTLIELMIVVAIIGVLAAVAIPIMQRYVLTSKWSEAGTMLQDMKKHLKIHFERYGLYPADIDWTPYAPAANLCVDRTHDWQVDVAAARLALWQAFGFMPDGPTWLTYRLLTSYDASGVLQAADPPNDVDVGPSPIKGTPWFYVQASADLDCDGAWARGTASSLMTQVIRTDAAMNVDDSLW